MKKLIIFILLMFPSNIQAQTIIGGPLSPDLTKLKPYPLIELQLKPPIDPATNKPKIINSIDWSIFSINNKIISHTDNFQTGDTCVFTGPPGNYLVHCNLLLDNKVAHANINVDIPSPTPVPTPTPVPVPVPITAKVFAAMVADTSNSTYLNSPQAVIWASTSIAPSLKNINVTWKHYDINSQVSNGKGALIPLKNSPWGAAAIDLITKTNNMPALVLIDSQGAIITTVALQNTEEDVIAFIKGKLNVKSD